MVMRKMRENTHIILWIVIFGFLATIVFSWGMDITGSRGLKQQGVVGSINGKEIKFENFQNMIRNQYLMVKNQYGVDLDASQMRNLRENIWQQLVTGTLQDEQIKEKNIIVSDQEIVMEIRNNPIPEIMNNPQFQTDGKFDFQKYNDALLNPGNDPWITQLEYMASQNIPIRKLQRRIVSTVRVTEKEIMNRYINENITAKAEYIFIPVTKIKDEEIQIMDSEVQNYFTEHKDDYKDPKKAKLRYVFFSTLPTKEDTLSVYDNFNEAKERIENGEVFDTVAVEYSADRIIDLGYFGRNEMVKEFEDAVFEGKKGELVGPVKTGQGIHLVKILDLKYGKDKETGKTAVDSVQAKHILFKFEASENTTENANYEANNFASIAQDEGFVETANADTLEIQETPLFSESSFIPGLGIAADVSYFALNFDIGSISNPLNITNGLVVAEITELVEERYKTVDEVSENIKNLLKESKKLERVKELAHVIHNEVQSGITFSEAAKKYELESKTTDEFKVGDYLPGVGSDIKFTAAAVYQEETQISKPIETTRGYFIIKTIDKTDFDIQIYNSKKDEIKKSLIQEKQNSILNEWINSLVNNSDIVDNRKDFYR